jgi:hypothetical protein
MNADVPLCLTRDATRVAPRASWPALAARFGAERRLLLPGLIASDLRSLLLRRLDHARFEPRVAARVHPPATDLKLRDPDLNGLLHFLFNDAAVVAFVRTIGGDRSITGFVGAVYRMLPDAGHRDSWHSDADGNRRVGLTVNLSVRPFAGGALSLRTRNQVPLWTFANSGPGDGLLFAIHPELEHRVQEVSGEESKTALAGWFCKDADQRT